MAGTGKSTISRTIAQSFADEDPLEATLLGATFFFKRGEGDRGNASRFFTTITSQLVIKVPALRPHVSKAIDTDPDISKKAMKEQFDKLIYQPLSKIKHIPLPTLVIVVDALDECEREEHIKTIIHLLSQTRHLSSIQMRIFVTSRPELPIRLGFKKMSADVHQDLILQDIPREIINHDISVFLKDEFAKIRDEFTETRDDNALPIDWPGDRNIQLLVKMVTPLFIFAATICRFVGDPRWDPEEQLTAVLKYQTTGQASKLDGTYLPVLDKLLVGLSDSQEERLRQEFQLIVGSIVILAEPLSTISLASLLGISKTVVDRRLDPLHSVLSIPSTPNSPVRLLHLSFRDFLLDDEIKKKCPLWVNGREAHEMIATKCLELMSMPGGLREDMCNLNTPGKLRSEIDRQTIDNRLPSDLRYACLYWVHHLEQSKSRICDEDQVHLFLQEHFLYWLEALSLMGKISESIALIGTLQSFVAVS